MNNRISEHWNTLHPLDQPEVMDRVRLLRALAILVLLVDCMIVAVVIMVVIFALGGRPLSGNAGRLAGIPIVTVISVTMTVAAIALPLFLVPKVWSRGIHRVRTQPAEPPIPGAEPDTLGERYWQVYAAGCFLEIALAESAVVLTAILFHLTADWLMMGLIAVLISFLLVRFPTESRARRWFQQLG